MRVFFKFALALSMAAGTGAHGAEAVDWIVRARVVVTMDATHRVIENGALAVRGNRILGVGSQAEIAARFSARHVLDKPEGLIAPGLIDTHTHAPMSLFRAIADDKRLQDWLEHFIFPAEARNVDAEFVRWGTRLACLEMLLSGITTYTDMYYFEEVEAETAREAGVRGVLGQTVIGFRSPDHSNWKETLQAAEQYFQKYAHDDLITPAIAPHAVYTTPDEALTAAHQLAAKYNRPLLIHLSETRKENEDLLAKRHLSPTELLDKLGVFGGTVVAAHSVWESDRDLDILASRHVGVAHCPSSNMKLASGVARVPDMLQRGIAVGLGTDGFAGSNDSADLIAEMNLAAKLHKVITGDPTALPAEQAFALATIGGAKVLGMQNDVGSLETGKFADLITVSLVHSNAHPLYNVYSFLAYAAKAADVEDVFINGKQVVSNRKPLTLDPKEIYRRAEEYREKIQLSLKR